MKGLTAFIVDDEPLALKQLADDLRKLPDVAEVQTFNNYADATLPILEVQPDVLFLDVEMPGKTGLDFLESIRPHIKFSFKVVFYTGFSEYLIDAVRTSAFDVLLKPYKTSELHAVVSRLSKEINAQAAAKQAFPDIPLQKLAVQTARELLLLSIDDILLFSHLNGQRTWQMTLTNRSNHILRKGLTAEDLLSLSPTLVRISQTHIINPTYLAAVENATQRCRLRPPFDDIDLSVSRRYFSKFKEKFGRL